jgi:hypothetical protein
MGSTSGEAHRHVLPSAQGSLHVEGIRYKTLTPPDHHEDGEKTDDVDRLPYTDAHIKRAITQGVDPGAQPLEWTMPRWQMSAQDPNALIAYLEMLW